MSPRWLWRLDLGSVASTGAATEKLRRKLGMVRADRYMLAGT